ncbi:Uma2 family endonuclease [Meiothermus cerbereus]|uniref:Uma2 family endonuclease n=1 Tax=Meiothermus cerbereus TaxID=65552 RepID=UPI003EEF0116
MPRSQPPVKSGVSVEEYLAMEARASERHEYAHGQVFAMAGGSERHNRLAFELAMAIAQNSRDSGCRVLISDVKVQTPTSAFYYPDIMVVCDASDDHPYIKRSPCLIVEVLSESTLDIDRGEKWLNYQTIASLQMYVLLEQDTIRAEVFRRVEGGWFYERIESGTLKLPCVDLEIALEDIYTRLG